MSDQIVTGIITLLTAVIGVAIIGVILSKNSQTGTILTSGGTAFSGILKTALSPITGSTGFSNMGGGLSLQSN